MRMQAQDKASCTLGGSFYSARSSSKFNPKSSYVFCSRFFDHVEPCSCHTLYIFDRPAPKLASINGTLDGMLKITQREGLTGLWRGLSPTLAMALPATVVYYLGYESIREKASKSLHFLDENSKQVVAPLIGGSLARIMAVVLISPLELLKTKMQHLGRSHGLLDVARDLKQSVQSKGISVLYRGLVPTLWRDVPFSAVYWAGYEHFRNLYSEHLPLRSNLDHFALSFFAGASAGMIAAALTTPFDVAKTRQQVESLSLNAKASRSIIRHLMEIWRIEGIFGLTLGIVPRICKVAPSCAIMVGSYELGKNYLRTRRGA